jgi:formamidopyrimidine-DNA glycosylase
MELPDLLHVVARLRERLIGLSLAEERVRVTRVLRFTVPGNLSLLLGRKLVETMRHGHFLILRFDGLDLVVNPAHSGRFRLVGPSPTDFTADERTLAFALGFHGADASHQPTRLELRYLDETKTGRAYLTTTNDLKAVPAMEGRGVDILSPQFTAERLVSLLKRRHAPVRAVLVDRNALDSLGQTYADEALFEARIYPKIKSNTLSHEESLRLHGAIVRVVREAVEEVARRNEPIDVKVRDFLKVRMKAECPRCGSKVHRVNVRSQESHFCPRCQPPPSGAQA